MAALGELAATLLPNAVAVRPLDATERDRDIAWVRVLKARVPAFDVLDSGDLVVVPASALDVVAREPADVPALADALAGAGVAAVIVVDPDPAAAREAAVPFSRSRVPTFVLVAPDPAPLERAIIGYLVNQQAELDRQASLLEAELERIALGASDLAALVSRIGGFLGRAVALEGRRGDRLAVEAPVDVPDAGPATAAYLGRGRGAVALRIPLPAASAHAGSPGALVLLGERPPTDLDRVAGERITGLLALEIARAESVQRARDDARRSEALPAAGPPWVVLLARQMPPGQDLPIGEREQIRREIQRLAPARRIGLRGDAASLELRLVAACPADDPAGLVMAGRVAAFLRRSVAVSEPFSEPDQRPAEEASARTALDAGDQLADPPPVIRAERLAAYRLLGNLRNLPDGIRLARSLLAPVLGGSAAVERAQLATLRALLDHGSPTAAAAALGVHRNTVAYRVRRFERVGNWDLDDPELRLALSLAVRIVQRAQI
ncbi:MAG TPA: helix-turn-helix domain-containing protein [Candidatus Acidoferrum sp.]|nr:helix-turn-helix domain-containing protein [Candidatus Acidoferrum sp.]